MSSNQSLRLRALARGVELSGGPAQLAGYLEISTLRLTFLLQGTTNIPEELFLRVVDLLTRNNVSELIASAPRSVRGQHG